VLSVHRWLGLILGPFLVVMGLTGAVLVFMHEADRALNPSVLSVAIGHARLPLDVLASRVRAAAPECALSDLLTGDMDTPAAALVSRLTCNGAYREALVDPYTGNITAFREPGYFINALFTLHSQLFLNDTGRLVLFVLAISWIVTSVIGVVAQRRFFRTLRNPFRSGIAMHLALSDFHKLLGLIAVTFNIIMGASGAWLTSGVVIRLFTPSAADGAAARAAAQPGVGVALDDAVATAVEAMPGFKANWIVLPRRAGAPLGLYGEVPGPWIYGRFSTTVNVDSTTGKITSIADASTGDWHDKVSALAVSLHFGNFGGASVKALWSALAFLPVGLAISGLWIWTLRRPRSNR
jgi:uncharacterized iron-regulated membrane protein